MATVQFESRLIVMYVLLGFALLCHIGSVVIMIQALEGNGNQLIVGLLVFLIGAEMDRLAVEVGRSRG